MFKGISSKNVKDVVMSHILAKKNLHNYFLPYKYEIKQMSYLWRYEY